jgi:two-component system, NarL family, nitrate/nitrite response regulator NarL
MKSVATCIVGGNHLLRAGLKSLLAETEYRTVALCQHIFDVQNAVSRLTPKLFLIGVNSSDEIDTAVLCAARAQYPDARMVVVTTEPSRDQLASCLTARIDGYLGADAAPHALLPSLRLVMSGVHVFPTMFMADVVAAQQVQNKRPAASSGVDAHPPLSVREGEVLAFLVEGASNKTIAIHLHIEESTVKLHLRRILKKVSAANRTQAAVWAAHSGFKRLPPEPVRLVPEPVRLVPEPVRLVPAPTAIFG